MKPARGGAQCVALAAVPARSRALALEAASGLTVAVTAAATYLARGTFFPRQTVATALCVAWGARLSWYLARRDVDTGVGARRLALARALWGAAASLPVVAVNTLQAEPERADASERAGAALAAAALALEAVADAQKAAWHAGRTQRPAPGAAEPPVCAAGLWRLSRHPNLFAEAAFHVGVALVVWRVVPPVVLAAPAALVAWIALLPAGPLQTLERQKAVMFAAHPRYLEYLHGTSPFVPLPPWLWRRF